LNQNMVYDKTLWHKLIYVADPNKWEKTGLLLWYYIYLILRTEEKFQFYINVA